MKKLVFTIVFFMAIVSFASAESGLISMRSSYGVKETADRLESILKEKGMNVFIRIDHAQGAQRVEEKLRPTIVLIFGNPKVGTPLMQCSQTIGIDLPQKALIWEDRAGQVWLSYNDPKYLADRHGITECVEVLNKVENALRNFANAATRP